MMSALDTLATFFVIAFSKLAQGTLSLHMPMSTHSADTVSSVICDAPPSESLPKALIVAVSIATSTTIGMSDNTAEGRFFSSSPFLFLFSDIYNLFSFYSI